MKIALVHDYLIHQGGSENCVEALLEIFPQAVIYTCYFNKETMPARWQTYDIRSSFLQKFALGGKNYQNRLQYFLPLMPLAYESLDLRDYDLVISSCHAYAKGVLTRVNTLHISYIHTPTRYLWDLYQDYLQDYSTNAFKKVLIPPILHYLRLWDFQAAQRPGQLVANSRYVARRIETYYRRAAVVINPPVDVDYFQPVAQPRADYYLITSRWVPYKRADLAIQAFNQLGLRLVVAGAGPELANLQALAGANIEFLPYQSRASLRDLLANCKALIFPGEEDFGILPVEAQACGRPVLAFGRGGAVETVKPGVTGLLFAQQTVASLVAAVQACEHISWDSRVIREHSEHFSRQRYQAELGALIRTSWQKFTLDHGL